MSKTHAIFVCAALGAFVLGAGAARAVGPTHITVGGASNPLQSVDVSCVNDTLEQAQICTTSGQCAAVRHSCFPYACAASVGTCTSSCAADSDCATGATCRISRGAGKQTGACVAHGDPEREAPRCSGSAPELLIEGDGTNRSCAPYRCDRAMHACMRTCERDDDCVGGTHCFPNAAVHPTGNACAKDPPRPPPTPPKWPPIPPTH
jgi:hypothetical protein